MRLRVTTAVAVVIGLLAFGAGAAHAASFTTPVQLKGLAGGEPSIAADQHGNVYVDGPQGIPAGQNDQAGVGFWASHDDGTSFGGGQNLGSFLGGGDSDVIVTPNGNVFIDDLEAIASEVCKSTDQGRTFSSVGPVPDPDHCSHVGIGQVGPSDDRPWLTTDRQGTLYMTYHEFVSAQPLIFRSDNGGSDSFTAGPCGSIITDPSIEANVPQDVTGGTLVGKPVTDSAGNLYVLFTTTTQAQNAAALVQAGQPSGTFSQLYLAVSHDHCRSFTDHTIFDGSKIGVNTVQFGDIFNALTVDGGGNLYTIGVGYVGHTPFASAANVYLFSSSDQGQTWRGPTQIGPAGAHMLPAAAGGPRGGELAVGYFHTVNGVADPASTAGRWTYQAAESTNATSGSPSFSYSDVNPGFIYHSGQICNAGVLCGAPGEPSDRSLLDFTSGAIDAHGCPLFTFAGNPNGVNNGTSNYVTRQTSGCFSQSANPGKHSAKAHKKKKKKKRRRHRRHRRRHHAVKPRFTG